MISTRAGQVPNLTTEHGRTSRAMPHANRRISSNGQFQHLSDAHRSAFTILELLVSIAILGLLAALILPAVQHIRETTRRTDCIDRLTQIGRATAHHEATMKRLPPAFGSRPYGSPHVFLLPQLDQPVVYAQLQKDGIHARDPQGLPYRPAYMDLPVLRCPSDFRDAGTSYRFNHGSDVRGHLAPDELQGPAGGHWEGIPGPAQGGVVGRTMAEITDGTSQTAWASESLMGSASAASFDPAADAWMGGFDDFDNDILTTEFVLDLCAAATANPIPAYPYSGWFWQIPGLDHTLYNHVLTPNDSRINCYGTKNAHGYEDSARYGLQKASSRHPGGVNVLLLDGSVHFVSDSVDLALWRGLGTSAGSDKALGFGG